jgi:RND family efflux transporter MFP subunit
MASAPTSFSARRLQAAGLIALAVVLPAARAETLGCLITPSKTVELGSPSAGIILTTHVERGDTVTANQIVVTLRSDVERANVDLAAARAGAQADLLATANAYALAQRKLERTRDLFRQEFVSAQAVDQALSEVQVAEARKAQALEQSMQAKKELLVAHAQYQTRTIRSPIDGIVIDLYRRAGERVEEKPMLKIATVNPLNAELVLPATLYGRLRVGSSVMVQPMLAGLPPVAGTVRLVDQVVDPASNTQRVRITLPNPDGSIPAGLRCQVQLPDAKALPQPVGLPDKTAANASMVTVR